MAGGMNKRGTWGPMSERTATQNTPEPPPIKPCWVTDSHGRLPALLMEWRRVEAGWQGRVVRPVLEEGGWIVVEEWLPAGLLDSA